MGRQHKRRHQPRQHGRTESRAGPTRWRRTSPKPRRQPRSRWRTATCARVSACVRVCVWQVRVCVSCDGRAPSNRIRDERVVVVLVEASQRATAARRPVITRSGNDESTSVTSRCRETRRRSRYFAVRRGRPVDVERNHVERVPAGPRGAPVSPTPAVHLKRIMLQEVVASLQKCV